MFDLPHSARHLLTPPSDRSAQALPDFVFGHREALLNAAALLAGTRGARLVLDILDDLGRSTDISARCRRKLLDLLNILQLENVDDIETEESARFALIDPASCVVEEICLLTDGLSSAIARAGLNNAQDLPSRAAP